eukprot:scaffold41272_cov35-Prasinocladus_malaysianus.AAC.1
MLMIVARQADYCYLLPIMGIRGPFIPILRSYRAHSSMQAPHLPMLRNLRLGHKTQHFNVGFYRRRQNKTNETQDATFFDKDNPVGTIMPFASFSLEGQEKRQQALKAALDDMLNWLSSGPLHELPAPHC